ncbi:hypothetical protein L0337_19375 [candidate division KSB1 bacterium]|nr:hypothetical protein [candidate division KSB1 bacterium]
MSTQITTDKKAAQSHELLQILLDLSTEEIAKLQRLLYYAKRLKHNGHEDSQATPNEVSQRPRRFIDPDDGGPVWELDLIDEFDRESCYEDFRKIL